MRKFAEWKRKKKPPISGQQLLCPSYAIVSEEILYYTMFYFNAFKKKVLRR